MTVLYLRILVHEHMDAFSVRPKEHIRQDLMRRKKDLAIVMIRFIKVFH
jgi:hypothetical protein